MFAMLSKIYHLNLSIELQLGIYSTLVLPILTYGCEVWGHHNLQAIELFHRSCLKKILKVSKYTCNSIIYGEMGTFNVELIISKRMVCFWNSLKVNDKNKISSVLLHLTTKFYNTNIMKSKWLLKIKEILIRVGTPYLWNTDGIG